MKKILIVDDQPQISRILNDLFTRAGYKTDIAINGEIAVQKTKEFKPDIILMDIMMPVKTGFEATQEIRELQDFKNTPVIFLTAKGQNSDRETADSVGATGFITKPFSPKNVLAMVEEFIGKPI